MHPWFQGEWWLLGTYPTPPRTPAPADVLTKAQTNLRASVAMGEGANRAEHHWIPTGLTQGRLNFVPLFKPFEAVTVYALRHVYSPQQQDAALKIYIDDGGVVALNGQPVYR